jgi:heparinase II/III-like protein
LLVGLLIHELPVVTLILAHDLANFKPFGTSLSALAAQSETLFWIEEQCDNGFGEGAVVAFVLDKFNSDGPHDYALLWHLASGSSVEQQAGDRCVVELEGSRLHLLTVSDGWLRTVESGWFSPAYGCKHAAPVVSITKRAQGSETIATVLWAGTLNSPAPTLTALSHSLGIPAYRLTIGASRSILILGDCVTTMEIEGWESDAKFL